VQAGGGTPAGAEDAANRLVRQGATALVSFGLAGGLDPALSPGDVVVPGLVLSNGARLAADAALAQRFGGLSEHAILAGETVVTDAVAKAALHATTGAHAVDLESGAVARVAAAHGLPFVVVRAICDPAKRDLPPAALIALNPSGDIGLSAVLRSVLQRPGQIPDLLALAYDAGRARRSLVRLAKRFGGI
jgi:adenosylhomocysteine nucleosidase